MSVERDRCDDGLELGGNGKLRHKHVRSHSLLYKMFPLVHKRHLALIDAVDADTQTHLGRKATAANNCAHAWRRKEMLIERRER